MCVFEQVRVAVHHPVIALQEKVFKPLLDAAYYSASNFHFDLTKAEALSLLEAFTHRQVRVVNVQHLLTMDLAVHRRQLCVRNAKESRVLNGVHWGKSRISATQGDGALNDQSGLSLG